MSKWQLLSLLHAVNHGERNTTLDSRLAFTIPNIDPEEAKRVMLEASRAKHGYQQNQILQALIDTNNELEGTL